MTTTLTGYTVGLDAIEREQLIAAVALAAPTAQRELDGAGMLLDSEAERLHVLADRLFLIGHRAV